MLFVYLCHYRLLFLPQVFSLSVCSPCASENLIEINTVLRYNRVQRMLGHVNQLAIPASMDRLPSCISR